MKKLSLFILALFLLAIAATLFSCSKEEIKPESKPNQIEIKPSDLYTLTTFIQSGSGLITYLCDSLQVHSDTIKTQNWTRQIRLTDADKKYLIVLKTLKIVPSDSIYIKAEFGGKKTDCRNHGFNRILETELDLNEMK